MLRSLVGSEMCIRDSRYPGFPTSRIDGRREVGITGVSLLEWWNPGFGTTVLLRLLCMIAANSSRYFFRWRLGCCDCGAVDLEELWVNVIREWVQLNQFKVLVLDQHHGHWFNFSCKGLEPPPSGTIMVFVPPFQSNSNPAAPPPVLPVPSSTPYQLQTDPETAQIQCPICCAVTEHVPEQVS
eukprot:TRINITY_DN44365_c0_g1_i1.p1 TRINITY_DN44365_c0_g1~~TRINITY_DN44365_c0_g1_i1.p1  ORF type:complete len:183 (+),score=36.03 TRINITY_DN44365_c0_g1_i1:109-657(+)